MKRKMLLLSATLTVALAGLLGAGCAGPGKASLPTPPPALTELSGKAVETMDAGGYTYICLEKDGKKTWVAAPVMKVQLGEQLSFYPGAEMRQFSSKALNRTFDSIVFSGGLIKAGATEQKKSTTVQSDEPILTGKVVETMDAANYTYLNVEKDGKAAWSAVPSTQVNVGDEVEVQPGTPMGQFTSKLLGRTFDAIYFSSGIKIVQAAAPAAAPAAAAAPASAAPAAAAAAPGAKADAQPDLSATLPSGHPKIDMAAVAAPAAKAPAQATPAAGPITGKVVETAEAGGYTYLCVEKDGKKTWIATQPFKVAVGDEVALKPGVTMNNFVSRSLNRTFDQIIFSDGPAD